MSASPDKDSTAPALARAQTADRLPRSRAGVAAATQVELAKLTGQLAVRIMIGLCVLAPFGFAALMRAQSTRPADTLFGRWAGTSGFATALTILTVAGQWTVPILAGLFAGDIFSSEDRHGTWKNLLTRSCSRTHLFLGKTFAATLAVWLTLTVLAVASIFAGVTIVGSAPLVGLSGQLITTSHAFALVLASWAFTLLPTTTLITFALLLSIASRSSVVGVIGPLLLALIQQLLALVASGQIARAILPATAFDAWHALFTFPRHTGPLVQETLISLGYTTVFAAASLHLLRRRAFAGTDAVPSYRRRVTIRIAVTTAAAAVVLAAVGGLGPSNLTANRLQASIAQTFARLDQLRYQWDTGSTRSRPKAPMRATCNRGAGTQKNQGAGDDWSCTVTDSRTTDNAPPVVLDVTLRGNGCYTAQAPPSVVGALRITGTQGNVFINPLYAFDGCFGTT